MGSGEGGGGLGWSEGRMGVLEWGWAGARWGARGRVGAGWGAGARVGARWGAGAR